MSGICPPYFDYLFTNMNIYLNILFCILVSINKFYIFVIQVFQHYNETASRINEHYQVINQKIEIEKCSLFVII